MALQAVHLPMSRLLLIKPESLMASGNVQVDDAFRTVPTHELVIRSQLVNVTIRR